MKFEHYNEYKNLLLKFSKYATHTIDCKSRIATLNQFAGLQCWTWGHCNCGLDELHTELNLLTGNSV